MFTGIVAAIGRIEDVEDLPGAGAGVRLRVLANDLDLSDVQIGDSIAIEGACMTVVALQPPHFSVDVSRESLTKTARLDRSGPVNLEKALRLSDRLGGHLVTGHVDGLGTVVHFEPVGESWRLVVRAPALLAKFLAVKGSITINGVSLTVNRVRDVEEADALGGFGVEFEINLIPHTIEMTTLKSLEPGRPVNLEVDLIARYCERILGYDAPADRKS